MRCQGRKARAEHQGGAPALLGVHSLNRPIGQARVLQPPGTLQASRDGPVCPSGRRKHLQQNQRLCLGQAESKTSPHPLEEVGSRFQAAREPVTGFMLMRALPQPALSLLPGPWPTA